MITISTLFGVAAALLLAIAFYLNERLRGVHAKLDQLIQLFDGLREYLYEIDPQFDEERELRDSLFSDEPKVAFDAKALFDLEQYKRDASRRTLASSFLDRGLRSARLPDIEK